MSQESTDLFKVGQAVRQELNLYATKVSLGNVQLNGSAIQSYTTVGLPNNAPKGTIVFDTTLGEHVYFIDGRWLKLADNSLVADRVVEIYILSGQSNAGGTGGSGNNTSVLNSNTQLDGTGTLADARSHILISNNNDSDQSGTPASYNAGTPHGIEASFLDGIDYVRVKKQFLVKYASGGSAIDTWDKAASDDVTNGGTRNNWDKLITSIDNAITWATEAGYTIEWKGFIWWQGESDRSEAAGTKDTYKTELTNLISNVRSHVSKPTLPVCVIEVDNRISPSADGAGSSSTAGMNNIQDAQAEVAAADQYVELIDVTQYANLMDWTVNSGGTYDGVHWQSQAYINIGYDVADRMNDIIEGTLNYQLPSPVLWFDADDATTVTFQDASAATQKVSEWRDKSGNNYHVQQSVGYRQPAYNLTPINGKNTMQFESSRQFSSAVPDPADFRDVYIVAEWDGASTFTHSSDSYKVLFSGGVHDNANQGIQTGANNKKLYNNGPFFDEIILNGSAFNITNDILDDLAVPFCINVRCNSYKPLDGFSISRDRSLDGREWIGKIAEIICFDNKLTDTERQKVEGYLAHKWGLTAKLPANHPYESTAP